MISPTAPSTSIRFMNSIGARLFALVIAIALAAGALATSSAHAQGITGMDNGSRRDHKKAAAKTEEQKPKVDEKAYDAALKSVPEKSEKPDPWKGVR